jgi:hypothetical protein
MVVDALSTQPPKFSRTLGKVIIQLPTHAVGGDNFAIWIVPRNSRDSAHCDFWRAHPSGLLYQLRGYDEDSTDQVQPGTVFDVTLPIWRLT